MPNFTMLNREKFKSSLIYVVFKYSIKTAKNWGRGALPTERWLLTIFSKPQVAGDFSSNNFPGPWCKFLCYLQVYFFVGFKLDPKTTCLHYQRAPVHFHFLLKWLLIIMLEVSNNYFCRCVSQPIFWHSLPTIRVHQIYNIFSNIFGSVIFLFSVPKFAEVQIFGGSGPLRPPPKPPILAEPPHIDFSAVQKLFKITQSCLVSNQSAFYAQ